MSTKPLKIYGVPVSVHTRKVILAAKLKAIPYEIIPVAPVAPDTLPANWTSISPTGLIPAIDDGGYILADSTAITLYLERKVAEPALLPSKLTDYGNALFLDAWAGPHLYRKVVHPIFINQVVAPAIWQTPGNKAEIDDALNKALPEAFGLLESKISGKFIAGSALSIADLAVVSNLVVFHYLGHRIDGTRYPKLAAYFRGQLELPAIAAVLADEKPAAEGFGLDRSFLP